MLITMFTDASWIARSGLAVWAVWAKESGKTLRYSGTLLGPVPNIAVAEAATISNGLTALRIVMKPPRGSKIIVQSDCLHVLQRLRGQAKRPPAWPELGEQIKFIQTLARAEGWELDLRHVKGHQGTVTPRHAVNTWCDQECRRLIGLALVAEKELAQSAAPEAPQAVAPEPTQ